MKKWTKITIITVILLIILLKCVVVEYPAGDCNMILPLRFRYDVKNEVVDGDELSFDCAFACDINSHSWNRFFDEVPEFDHLVLILRLGEYEYALKTYDKESLQAGGHLKQEVEYKIRFLNIGSTLIKEINKFHSYEHFSVKLPMHYTNTINASVYIRCYDDKDKEVHFSWTNDFVEFDFIL